MIYILETELDNNKSLYIALTNIYGINFNQSLYFCKKLGFSKNLKVNELSNNQITKLIRLIENSNILINNDLKKKKSLIIKNMISIKLNRGIRLTLGLPNRGQRTHTNAKSARKFKHRK